MPIYQALNTAFVHIPKTAGSSAANALYNKNKELNGLSYELEKHETALDIQRYLGGNKVFMPYFKFAIVRNPWDRLLSWYTYYKEHWRSGSLCDSECNHKCGETFLKADFNSWVTSLKLSLPEDCKNTIDCPMLPLIPQSRYITDYGGFILVDEIIRFESLKDGWKTICSRIGAGNIELPHLNNGEARPYKECYTDEAAAIVENIYEMDCEYFGYSF